MNNLNYFEKKHEGENKMTVYIFYKSCFGRKYENVVQIICNPEEDKIYFLFDEYHEEVKLSDISFYNIEQ